MVQTRLLCNESPKILITSCLDTLLNNNEPKEFKTKNYLKKLEPKHYIRERKG
jgi:hypothetical protein